MLSWLFGRKQIAPPALPLPALPAQDQVSLILSSLSGVIPDPDLEVLRRLNGPDLASRLAQSESRLEAALAELGRVQALLPPLEAQSKDRLSKIRLLEGELKHERACMAREREEFRCALASRTKAPSDPAVQRFEWLLANHAEIAPTLVDVPPNLRSLPLKNSAGAVVRWRLHAPAGKYVSRIIKDEFVRLHEISDGKALVDCFLREYTAKRVTGSTMQEVFAHALEDIGTLAHDGQLLREFPQFYRLAAITQLNKELARHVDVEEINPFRVLPNEILAAAHLGLFRVSPGGVDRITNEGFSIGLMAQKEVEDAVDPYKASISKMSGILARISVGVENAWRQRATANSNA